MPASLPASLPISAEAPIPLTHKMIPSGDVMAAKAALDAVSGEIPPVKSRPTGDAIAFAFEPTVQVKVDTDGTPLELPPVRPAIHDDVAPPSELPPVVLPPAPLDASTLELPPVRPVTHDEGAPPAAAPISAPPIRRKTPTPSPVVAAVRNKTPIPARVTPAAAFDAVEADFFAREADLYKRETVETFDDLDPMGGGGAEATRSKNRRRHK